MAWHVETVAQAAIRHQFVGYRGAAGVAVAAHLDVRHQHVAGFLGCFGAMAVGAFGQPVLGMTELRLCQPWMARRDGGHFPLRQVAAAGALPARLADAADLVADFAGCFFEQ